MQTLDFGVYCQMKRFLGLPVSPNPVAEFDANIPEFMQNEKKFGWHLPKNTWRMRSICCAKPMLLVDSDDPARIAATVAAMLPQLPPPKQNRQSPLDSPLR